MKYRTIKNPAKRGTITVEQARKTARQVKRLREVKAKPNREVVTALNDALVAAKAGTVRGMLLITEEPHDVVSQYVYGSYGIFKMIGAMEVAKQDLLNQCDQVRKGELKTARKER